MGRPCRGMPRQGRAAPAQDEFPDGRLQYRDYGRAASKLGNAAIHAADAAGGLVTPIIGMANRAVRATVARAAQNTAKDLLEAGHATFVGKEAAAQARVEKMANRPGVTQLSGKERQNFNDILSRLPKFVREKVKFHLQAAIGDAGEFYFEDVLRRWSPSAPSEAQAKRMQRVPQSKAEGERIEKSLRLSRGASKIKPDALIPGKKFINIKDNKIKILNSDLRDKPSAVNVKTGGYPISQKQNYDKHASDADVNGDNEYNNKTINIYAFIAINYDEFKKYILEAMELKYKYLEHETGLTAHKIKSLKKNINNILSVANLDEWLRTYFIENYSVSMIRSIKNVDTITKED